MSSFQFNISAEEQLERRKKTIMAVLIILIIVSVILTQAQGTPNSLPGIALGSTLLLYTERALAFFAVGLVLAGIIDQGLKGKLPNQFGTSGVSYQQEEINAAEVTKTGFNNLTATVEKQRMELNEVFYILRQIAPDTVQFEEDSSNLYKTGTNK